MSGALRGYVLAGGRSSRFGTDKASFVFRGQALAVRAAGVLADIAHGPAALVVGALTAEHQALGLRLVLDRHPGLGPLSGIHAALDDAGSGLVVVAACDMPWLDGELLAAQVRLLEAAPEALVCSPRLERWEPLHAVYRREALDVVEQSLREGRYRMQDVIAALRPIDPVGHTSYSAERWASSARGANTRDDLESGGAE